MGQNIKKVAFQNIGRTTFFLRALRDVKIGIGGIKPNSNQSPHQNSFVLRAPLKELG